MIKSLCWVFGFLLLGEAIALVLPLPLPGSVIGMSVLALGLRTGLVHEDEIRPAGELLVGNMAFFFVPSGVLVLMDMDILTREWLPVLVASIVSAALVSMTVGLVMQRGDAQ